MLYPRRYTLGIFLHRLEEACVNYCWKKVLDFFCFKSTSNKIFLSRKLNKFVYDNIIIQATLSFM